MFELLKIIEFWPGVGQNFKQSLKSPKQASAIFCAYLCAMCAQH